MWYIKHSPIQLANIRYIANGEEHELNETESSVKTFDEAKELFEKNMPGTELSYFHILTETELLENQCKEYNKMLQNPEALEDICEKIAHALMQIGHYEPAFLEQVLVTQKVTLEEEDCNGLSVERYSDIRVRIEVLKTAIKLLRIIEAHREEISNICLDVEARRKKEGEPA